MVKKLLCFAFAVVLYFPIEGQTTYQQIAKDTIVQIPGLLGKTYLLDGKKLNLSVMEWFMTDYPEAHEQVRAAVVTDQLSIVSYTFGGLMGIAGILTRSENRSLSNDLLTIGGVGVGGGITLQIISGSFQRRAVHSYNANIRSLYKNQTVGYRVSIEHGNLTLGLHFD
jgi:hypothetical protein